MFKTREPKVFRKVSGNASLLMALNRSKKKLKINSLKVKSMYDTRTSGFIEYTCCFFKPETGSQSPDRKSS